MLKMKERTEIQLDLYGNWLELNEQIKADKRHRIDYKKILGYTLTEIETRFRMQNKDRTVTFNFIIKEFSKNNVVLTLEDKKKIWHSINARYSEQDAFLRRIF